MVWLLTALWVFLYTVKSVHGHAHEVCDEVSGVAHSHEGEDCPVCHFTLLVCLETPLGETPSVPVAVCFRPGALQKKLSSPCHLPVTPRAPPRSSRYAV